MKLVLDSFNLAAAERFVLDGDSWKQSRALTLWMRLHGKAAGYVRLPPKVDPDEVNPRELVEAAKRSISAEIEV